MRIAFTTLGCKVNQFETDVMRRDFAIRGNTIVPFNADADVYIINTCSVTSKSDYQCRQAIRSAVRRNHGARVVVTGCYAETRPDEIMNISGVSLVIGNRDKAVMADHVMSLSAPPSAGDIRPADHAYGRALCSRTRGFLKIQDGCDNHCSYCIVPLARGNSKSAALQDVICAFEHLVQAGCPEVVLTGIHIGMYGMDLGAGIDITGLLQKLIAVRGDARLRLSSIEPREITQELIGFLGHGICRHLHIPLQSGDDAILAAMKRDYTAGFYRELLENIAKRAPGAAIGADVMVGFPGEGEKAFQNTMLLIEQSPLTHLHVFSYSRRPGTSATGMKGQVPEGVKKERNKALRLLAEDKNFSFRKRHEGAELKIVVEHKIDASTGLLTGLTDNYIRVHVSGAKKEHIGKKVMVKINNVKEQANFAEIL